MFDDLLERYPCLTSCMGEIHDAVQALIMCYEQGGKVMICGNGGSCADADHIVGELMKGFLKKRPLTPAQKQKMKDHCPNLEDDILKKLQQVLPTISLSAFASLNTAFCNDVDPKLMYAQAVLSMGKPGDAVICISTSGNAENCFYAAQVARSMGLKVIGLTGASGGKLNEVTDIGIRVPEAITYKVQELHLPVYHCICAAIEDHSTGNNIQKRLLSFMLSRGGVFSYSAIYANTNYSQAASVPAPALRRCAADLVVKQPVKIPQRPKATH